MFQTWPHSNSSSLEQDREWPKSKQSFQGETKYLVKIVYNKGLNFSDDSSTLENSKVNLQR